MDGVVLEVRGPVVPDVMGTVILVTLLVSTAVVCGTIVAEVSACVVPAAAEVSCPVVPDVID